MVRLDVVEVVSVTLVKAIMTVQLEKTSYNRVFRSVELETRDSLEADWRSVPLGTGRQNWEFDAPLSLNGHALSLPIPDNVLKMTDA